MPGLIAKLLRAGVVALSVYCGGCATDAGTDAPVSYLYADPQPVMIEGYGGDVMEPFLTRDGRTLFFNNSNHPAVDTNLHYAERVDDLRFLYRGEVRGTWDLHGAVGRFRGGRR